MRARTKHKGVKFFLVLAMTGLLLPSMTLAGDPGLIRSGVRIVVRPGSGPQNNRTRCEGTITSCGKDGVCMDLTGLVYCVNGRIVETICRYNRPRNRTTSIPCKNVRFNLTVKDEDGLSLPAELVLYKPESANVIKRTNMNTPSVIETFEKRADLVVDFNDSRLVIKVKNLSLENLDSKAPQIIIDGDVNPIIPNNKVYMAYKIELPSSFDYSSITLTFKYSGIDVTDENNLMFYKCTSFNSETNECNEEWKVIRSVTIDYVNKLASININSFSVYALGEPDDNNTSEETCEDLGYNNTCSVGTECEVIQVSPTLQCCNCVPVTTTSMEEETDDTSSTTTTTSTLPECTRHRPYVSMNPLSQSGMVGETLEYNVTIKNKDSPECESREFEFDFTLPGGWNIDYENVGSIKPGESRTIPVMITPSEDAVTNRSYQLSLLVFDVETGERSNTVYFKYNVKPLLDEKITKEKKEASQITSLITFIARNQFMVVLPTSVALLGHLLWKARSRFIYKEKEKNVSISYDEPPREEIILRLEPSKREPQPKKNEQRSEARSESSKRKVIEEIRKRALREEKRIRSSFG